MRLPDKEDRALFSAKLVSAHGDVAVLEKTLDDDILAFQSLVEEGFVFRQKIAASAIELKAKSDSGQPLSGADLDRLNSGIIQGMDIIRRIFADVDIHANWRTVSAKELTKAGFSAPLPVPLQTKGTMLSLAGSLFLYDSYRLEIAALSENEKTRRILNAGDKGYQNKKNLLNDLTEEFLSSSQRIRRCHSPLLRREPVCHRRLLRGAGHALLASATDCTKPVMRHASPGYPPRRWLWRNRHPRVSVCFPETSKGLARNP